MSHTLREGASTGHHDHQDHHDHHDAGPLTRARHAVADLLGAHSHDSTDQVDDAMEADAAGRRALWTSLAALLVTAGVQGLVVVLSGSVALLGDTLHNLADALTAVPLLVAFALARRAATRRFTYGFGRAEDLAGLVVVVVIALSALAAGYESVVRLLHPETVSHLWAVALAGVVGFAGNEVVARYRIRVGRRIGSAALVADGLHARTDGVTSLAVVLGAGGVAVGWTWADPVVGLLIAIGIVGVLRSAVTQVGARLMDAVDPDLVDRAEASLRTVEGVLGVGRLRMRWMGHTLHAEAVIEVAPTLALADAQAIADHARAHLVLDVPHLSDVSVRLSAPAR